VLPGCYCRHYFETIRACSRAGPAPTRDKNMHIHILGICGTFMGSLAVLAKQLGHTVSGSDANVYPPMSTQLEAQGIALQQGFSASHLQPHPDLVVIGNAMSRGNPAVEYTLDQGLDYCSGPEWLARHVLRGRWVMAVAGTHGKTTTSSMLAWILSSAGLKPGYLIGGVARNFAPPSSTTWNSIMATSSPTSPPYSASSTIWCASFPAVDSFCGRGMTTISMPCLHRGAGASARRWTCSKAGNLVRGTPTRRCPGLSVH
jgi:hypothetical protein